MKIEYRGYSENNINFRIASSKMMERYKSQQFFILTEMESGSYKFSKTSRELAIIFMDSIFAWIITVENYLIRSHSHIFTHSTRHEIGEKLIDVIDYVSSVAEANCDIFDKKEADIILRIIKERRQLADEILAKTVGENISDAFSYIVNMIIESLDNFRFELYEVDYLINSGKKPFLCITDFMIDIHMNFNVCIAHTRASIYKEEFGVEKFNIKNYSSSPSVSSQVLCLREHGVEINNVT